MKKFFKKIRARLVEDLHENPKRLLYMVGVLFGSSLILFSSSILATIFGVLVGTFSLSRLLTDRRESKIKEELQNRKDEKSNQDSKNDVKTALAALIKHDKKDTSKTSQTETPDVPEVDYIVNREFTNVFHNEEK